MAEAIAEHLGEDLTVVIAGNGHLKRRFGIPDRVQARIRVPAKTAYLAPKGSRIKLSDADYLWITPCFSG